MLNLLFIVFFAVNFSIFEEKGFLKLNIAIVTFQTSSMKISIVNFPWFSKISSSNWAGIKSQENHSFMNVMFNCLFANVTLNHIKKLIGLIWMFYSNGSYLFSFLKQRHIHRTLKLRRQHSILDRININSSLYLLFNFGTTVNNSEL